MKAQQQIGASSVGTKLTIAITLGFEWIILAGFVSCTLGRQMLTTNMLIFHLVLRFAHSF
jgi:hypothetical protein